MFLQQISTKRSDKHIKVLYAKSKKYASIVNSTLDDVIDVEVELEFE